MVAGFIPKGTPFACVGRGDGGVQVASYEHPRFSQGRLVLGSMAAVGVVALVSSVAAAALAVVFARAVVTPPKKRVQDLRILTVTEHTITVSATIDSLTPGHYGLWFSDDTGHARVGEIVSYTDATVTRQLLGVDFGELESAHRGRLGGWFYLSPAPLGLDYTDIEIETELGPAPAWVVPAAQPTSRWVIQVHGRAVRRQEAIRAIPAFHAAGYTALLISYRNDGDAPRSSDHRYGLGDTEWRDVDAAMRYAISHGAEELVLMGWSMGGATVLQAATRSSLAKRVKGIVLESPVVDWVTALHYQGRANRLPSPVRYGALTLLSQGWARLLTGQSAPIDLERLDLLARADELTVPILLFHSEDDGYVPVTGSAALALARPDIVRFEHFTGARHTKLWNYDPDRWNAAITSWLEDLG